MLCRSEGKQTASLLKQSQHIKKKALVPTFISLDVLF